MPWRVIVTARALKDLDRLPSSHRDAILRALARLADDPGSVDFAKLGGHGDEWRLRVGRWRVLVLLDNATGTMQVTRILPRSKAYRD